MNDAPQQSPENLGNKPEQTKAKFEQSLNMELERIASEGSRQFNIIVANNQEYPLQVKLDQIPFGPEFKPGVLSALNGNIDDIHSKAKSRSESIA